MASAGDQLIHPTTGERILFLRTATETGGELLEMEDLWPPRHRTSAHAHPEMEERWEVIAGAARFRVGDGERTVRAGEAIVARAGVPHMAAAASEEPVRLLIQMRPALRWEQFVERLFALPEQAEPGRGPDRAALLALLAEFPREIALPAGEAQPR